MSLLPIFFFVPFLILHHGIQQQGIEGRAEYYFVMEIGAAVDGGKFDFEGVQLTRSGKECSLSRFNGKAPFRLSLTHETILILRGKAGQAKVVMKFKVRVRRENPINISKRVKRLLSSLSQGRLPALKPGGGPRVIAWHQNCPSWRSRNNSMGVASPCRRRLRSFEHTRISRSI